MKDITSTSFGLIIAFLLPGFASLYSFTYWISDVKTLFLSFSTANSTIGLLMLVALASLTLGLVVTAVRWIIFELLICGADRLTTADFCGLKTEARLAAFRAAVDEHYRYHQFWGGMTVVFPFLFFGGIRDIWSRLTWAGMVGAAWSFIAVEGVVAAAAFQAYRLYVTRSRSILQGE